MREIKDVFCEEAFDNTIFGKDEVNQGGQVFNIVQVQPEDQQSHNWFK